MALFHLSEAIVFSDGVFCERHHRSEGGILAGCGFVVPPGPPVSFAKEVYSAGRASQAQNLPGNVYRVRQVSGNGNASRFSGREASSLVWVRSLEL
jgi:hypothetical protein